MKNKVELKKFTFRILSILIFTLILFLIVNIYEYRKYTENFNKKINSIVDTLQNKYPNLTEKEIIDILNSDSDKESNILKKYGMNLTNKSIIVNNDKLHYKYLILNICILLLGFLILISLFMLYIKKRNKNIADITKYIEELNKRNYSLKIDSNTEDELSILKNEIYKTTIMLRETRDISLNDKMNLKKSLEDISHQWLKM